jgi:hypothetical protein
LPATPLITSRGNAGTGGVDGIADGFGRRAVGDADVGCSCADSLPPSVSSDRVSVPPPPVAGIAVPETDVAIPVATGDAVLPGELGDFQAVGAGDRARSGRRRGNGGIGNRSVLKTLNFSNALLPVAGTSAEARAVCSAERAPCNEPSAEILPGKLASFLDKAVSGRCSSDINWLMMLFTSRFEPRPGEESAMIFSCRRYRHACLHGARARVVQAVCVTNSPLMLSSVLAMAIISSDGIWRITSLVERSMILTTSCPLSSSTLNSILLLVGLTNSRTLWMAVSSFSLSGGACTGLPAPAVRLT